MSKILLLTFELIGIIAFALSGALTALKKDMDVFGVVTLGLITSVGGGVIRDVILGNTPPEIFTNPIYGIVAIVTSLIVLIPKIRRFLNSKQHIFEKFLLFMDSLGLAVFTVLGIKTSITVTNEYNFYLLVFVAVISGNGGGILRDVLAGDKPYIFIKHFYAMAGIIGAVICICLWNVVGNGYAMIIGAVIIFILRICAARFHWNLPSPKI